MKTTALIIKEGKNMTARELSGVNDPGNFRIKKGGRVVWESISMKNSDQCYISRVCEEGGKPFLMGLRYKSAYIHPDTELEMIQCCQYCGDKRCTSVHK
jgi:hypothetical protein